jgi:hypothetical protein
MAFGDPLSVTITGFNGGLAISLPRTEDERFRSVYTSADGLTKLEISHSPSGTVGSANYRIRSMMKLSQTVVATDPFNADRSIQQTFSTYIVADRPSYGFTQTNMKDAISALITLLSASSYAATLKLLGSEH